MAESLPWRKQEEFGQQAISHEQDLLEVDDANDPKHKKTRGSVSHATQHTIDPRRLHLRGIRVPQIAGRETTQYRVV